MISDKSKQIILNCIPKTDKNGNQVTYDNYPVSECRMCDAKKDCNKETWKLLGGRV